ncbi:thioredoxin-related transmembrane protein 2-like [Melia azedarach]|uniref:Thioredoxin-related transmembrane protein 2-like n=1 Tax=Melia azedarach TaxID=155640 RepID=A0ACC1XAD5_MELAZ|nr:thioredoxin-related transmembrane protein 2-like [Melia azedarach]
MEWLNRLVSEPYYLSHFTAFLSYLIVRSSAAGVLSPHIINSLFHREIQATLAFSVLVAVKIAREEAWEEFIPDTLFYAKVLLIAMTLLIDYHLALWYMVVFLVIYILTEQPAFGKVGTSSKLTPLQLEALLTEGKTSRYWLVEFRAQFSSTSVRASRCFPELSITYSNKILSFGIVDLGLFPNAAEKFGISLGSLGQLPTYILFDTATEINRFPEFSFEEKLSHPPITKRLLAQHFQLDRLLIEYVNGD